MAGTHSEERQSQRVKSTDGWIGGTRGETKAHKAEEKHLVFNTQCAQCAQEKSTAEMR